MIIIDYYSTIEEWYSGLYKADGQAYCKEKSGSINTLIEFALTSSDFDVFSVLSGTPRRRGLHPSIESLLKEKKLDFDFCCRIRQDQLQKYEKIYYCGAALTQCIMFNKYGYLRVEHLNKILVKDAIFCQLGCKDLTVERLRTKLRRFEFDSIKQLRRHENDFVKANKIPTTTVDELLCQYR